MKLKMITFILVSILLSSFTAWADLTKTEISQLYVSVFNRASEGEGNAYWQSQSEMATAATAMLNTDAAKNYFGANLNTNQAFIEHIYLNTLNKTIANDFDGINYWVGMLDEGISRGRVVATLVGVIKDYAPDGPYYDPENAATIGAYNQFTNRVTVSDYMADTVYNTPEDWETSTSFNYGLIVTDARATVDSAKVVVNSFNGEPPLLVTCGAYVAPGVWKEFDCYNLAAIGKTTGDDPFTPSWRLIGGYWQWGRKGPDSSQWYDTSTPNFAHGPTGPDAGNGNYSSVSGWDQTDAPNGAWSDGSKTANDPCPIGFRVPTKNQWQGVINNNIQSNIGTWNSDIQHYNIARFFGNDLMLPATGYRVGTDGSSVGRGYGGGYWSSTEAMEGTESRGCYLGFSGSNSSAVTECYYLRRVGGSMRCIAE